jgi:NAD(P)-dependent dehydrogenase (short-subunit alcohol dehydrogenase family)
MSDRVKRAVVTGATSGIGRWIASGLAAAGYALTLIARDEARAGATVAWIKERTPDAVVTVRIADLSSLAETRAVAAGILAETPRLDLLVNNAGVLAPKRQVTAEGHERTLATNLLSPLALTEALLPALRAAAPSRIVMIGSSTSDRARIDPENLELVRGWSMVRAYSQSKLALLMESRALAQRLAGSGVTVNVVHPGIVATEIVRQGGIVGLAWRVMASFSLTPERGADTPLHACLSPELAGQTGLYLKRRKPAKPNPLVHDAVLTGRVSASVAALLS